MKKVLTLILIVLTALPALAQKEYTVGQVPDVHKINREWFVSDPDTFLTDAARDRVNQRLRALMDTTGVEVAVVVLPSIGDADIFDFTQRLASKWAVGKKDKNNGLILLFDMGGRSVRIHTGKGLEGALPDAACNRIIDEVIVPHMRTGDLDDAVVDATDKIYSVLTDPDVAAEVSSASPNDQVDLSEFVHLILMLGALVAIGFYIAVGMKLYHLRGKTDFERTRLLSASLPTYWIFAVLSLGMGIPGALFLWWLAKHYRNRPKKCDVCGTMMHKLPEDEDNKYLTPAQDLEENLNSVDYDVWLCPKCGTTDIFPFEQQSPYQPCPHCGARAYSELYNRVERQPTTMREGHGVKVYGCKNCNYRRDVPYRIARLTPPIIIAGSGRGPGGGGGGMSGGSWGGGSFGGGGASGSW